MTLFEAARRDPRLLVLHGIRELQTWLERSPPNARGGDRFQVRVRGRLIFSGPFPDALLRYERARDAQFWRYLEAIERRRRRQPTPGSAKSRQPGRGGRGGWASRGRAPRRSRSFTGSNEAQPPVGAPTSGRGERALAEA